MIYIFDKKQAIIKVLTNDDFTAAHLNFKINTATTFEFSLPASKALPSDSKYVATPHPLNDSKFIMLRLTERVDNTETIDYSAYELAYQELATDGYIEDKRPQNQSALNLMKIALDGSNWELNNVNVSGAATTNFYYVDRLSAISKVVDLLGGEIVFYIEIQGNAISGRYMDYLARQGADTSKVFASGSNLLTVERQSDTSNIYTAILPRGKGEEIDNGDADIPDGYGRRINISDVEWKKSSGKPLDKPKGSIVLSDPDATAEWGQINGNARLLLQTYDDIDDVNVLINSAYKTLQSVNHPQIQYSATVADVGGLSLGDTVLVMHGDRDLSYKTRVFEVKYDLLSPDQTELSLGDDLSSNSITSQINNFNAVADTTSSQTQWTINQIGRPGTTYGETAPDSPKVGDIWFKYLADGGTEIYRWNGDIWELLASPTTADDIAAAVDDAVSQAKAHTDEVKQSLSTDIDTAKSQAASQANKAEANAKSAATSQFTQAQSALSAAKSDLTNSIASEASARNAAVAAANSQAQTYANQAKADAMSAASSADGVIRTAISSSADSLSATITQNKSSADSGISTAQTTAQQAVDGLKFKVSQTDYDQKTGDLSTKINDVKQTADSSAQTIADIKIADGKQDVRMSEIENTASGLKSTVSDLQTAQGKQSGDISTLQQRADGFDATVTKVNDLSVGGRNVLQGTRDFSGNNWLNLDTIWKKTNETYNGLIVVETTNDWNGISQYYQVKQGETYTFSIFARYTSGAGTSTIYVYLNSDPENGYKAALINNTSIGCSIDVNWKKFSITFTATTDGYIRPRMERTDNNTNVLRVCGFMLEKGTVATDWTPAPEDLSSATAKAQLTADNATLSINNYKTDADGRISKAQADIITNANAITQKVSQTDYDKKTGDLTTAVNTAQSTANSAVTTIGDYKTSNDQRVKAAESAISQNANDITSKVSQTDYNQKTGELSGSISTLQQRADGFDATVTKVNNLSVGGRNLFLGTKDFSVNGNWFISGNLTENVYQGLDAVQSNYAWGGPKYNNSALESQSVIQSVADTFVMSAWVRNTGTTPVSIFFYGNLISPQNYKVTVLPANSGWVRINSQPFKFWQTSGLTGSIRFEPTTDSENGYVQQVGLKLEKGNVATDWTPAPEDVQSDITQVKITADSISNFVRDSSGNISSDFQTALSKSSVIVDGNNKMISLINQKSDEIVAQISSVNLFPNSEFESDYGYESLSGDVKLSLAYKWVVGANQSGVVEIRSTASSYQGYRAEKIAVFGGSTISFSVLTHYEDKGVSWGQAGVDMSFYDRDGNETGKQSIYIYPQADYWHKLSLENIYVPDTSVSLSITLIVNDAGAGQYAVFAQPMLVNSSTIKKYSPNTDITTTLMLLKDKWAIGLADNIGNITSGIIGDSSSMSLISKNIVLDGNTTVTGDFYAKGGNFKNLNASNMTVGTLNGTQVNITNINANNIVSGAISGANLNINLNTGSVVFQKGRINSSDYTTDINIDQGYISTAKGDTRALLTQGKLQLIDPTVFSPQTNPYLEISNLSSAFNGMAALIKARDSLTVSMSGHDARNYSTPLGTETFVGMSIGLQNNSLLPTKIGGANQGVVISGGTDFKLSNYTYQPFIYVGTNATGSYPAGNRVYISASYLHSPSTYYRTTSGSANVVVSTDGALVRSSSARKYKLDIKNNVPMDDSLKLIDVPLSTWVDKHEHDENGSNERYFGMIAEDLRDAGLEYLVQYGDDNEVEGINYDRVALLLIPLVKELKERIEELESKGK